MVPSPPSTISTSSFCPAASAKNRSISFASPHHTFGPTTPAPVRILSIFCSDSKSQPPLEVLIMTPTLNSGKRMSLGTNHERMEEKFNGAAKHPFPWTRVENGSTGSCRHDRFRSALLVCELARTVSPDWLDLHR